MRYGVPEDSFLFTPQIILADDGALEILGESNMEGEIHINAIQEGQEAILIMPDLTYRDDDKKDHWVIDERNSAEKKNGQPVLTNTTMQAGARLTLIGIVSDTFSGKEEISKREVTIGAVIREPVTSLALLRRASCHLIMSFLMYPGRSYRGVLWDAHGFPFYRFSC